MTSSYYPIHEKPGFQPDAYAEKIDSALKASNKDAVAKLIVDINNAQRQRLKIAYNTRYGKELDKALDKMYSGDDELVILALMKTPLKYDMDELDDSMRGRGTNENKLIEIICSRTPAQLKVIAEHYDKDPKSKPREPLAKTIEDDTSGEFKKLLVKLVNGSKKSDNKTDDAKAHDDAVRLFADGKGKFKGADASYFLDILATQNVYQLRNVFAEFEKLSGQPIENAIKKEFTGDTQDAYLAIVEASVNKQKFFAKQLYKSMKGFGTREKDLTRVIVGRSEVDLHLIKEEYKQLYGKTLETWIEDETSGVFRNTLLNICAGNKA